MPIQLCCPWCNAPGLNRIGSQPTGKQAAITYCRDCMAIRGVMPLLGPPSPARADRPLRCPWCNAFNKEQPKIALVGNGWVVVSCHNCGAIHGITPIIEPQAAPPKPAHEGFRQTTQPETEAVSVPVTPNPFGSTELLAEIGSADLAAKRAHYEAEMTRRAMMAKGGGTLYRTVALDDGPPYCLTCHRDMESHIVPPGYQNSGQKVWLCPNRCGAWEAG